MEKLELEEYLCLFDLDGTLIASDRKISQAVFETRTELSYPQIPVELLIQRIGLPASELFYDLGLDKGSLQSAVDRFRENLAQVEFSEQDVFLGVREVLTRLAESKCELMVATNKPKHLAEIALNGTGISTFFSYVSGGDNQPAKPDPAILNACIVNSTRKKAVMVGDRIDDIKAALFAGAEPIGIAQGVYSTLELTEAGAKKVFRDAGEFLNALENGWSFGDL